MNSVKCHFQPFSGEKVGDKNSEIKKIWKNLSNDGNLLDCKIKFMVMIAYSNTMDRCDEMAVFENLSHNDTITLSSSLVR